MYDLRAAFHVVFAGFIGVGRTRRFAGFPGHDVILQCDAGVSLGPDRIESDLGPIGARPLPELYAHPFRNVFAVGFGAAPLGDFPYPAGFFP
jgi:hypothetical protein